MDPEPNPRRGLEHFQAHCHARELAVLTLRTLGRASPREGDPLGGIIVQAALAIAGELARAHALPADTPERQASQRAALGLCASLESHLLVAREAKAMGEREGVQLEERLTSTRRLIHGLLRAQARDRAAVRPASPAPSRRPPSSGGGSRGGDPWGSRS